MQATEALNALEEAGGSVRFNVHRQRWELTCPACGKLLYTGNPDTITRNLSWLVQLVREHARSHFLTNSYPKTRKKTVGKKTKKEGETTCRHAQGTPSAASHRTGTPGTSRDREGNRCSSCRSRRI